MIALLLSVALGLPLAQAAEPQAKGSSTTLPRYPAPEGFFGMVIRDPYYEYNYLTDQVRTDWIDAQMSTLAPLGVEWVRFEYHANPQNNDPELTQADYAIQQAHANDLKVLMLLSTNLLIGPENTLWNFNDYPVAQEYCVNEPGLPLGCGLTPFMESWLRRALLIADHYEGRVDAYEIFNEQNIYYGLANARWDRGMSYQDEMDPVRVARTIAKFYRILRERGDTTPVIIGGLHPGKTIQTTCRACTLVNYIKMIYQSESFKGYYNLHGRWPADGLGYHPYPEHVNIDPKADDPSTMPQKLLTQIKMVLGALRPFDKDAKLWITEIGYRGRVGFPDELDDQSEFMRNFFQVMWYQRDDVANIFWFKQEDWAADQAWGVYKIPWSCTGEAGYHEPCRYSADPSTWTLKPSASLYQDRAFNGFPQMSVYQPLTPMMRRR